MACWRYGTSNSTASRLPHLSSRIGPATDRLCHHPARDLGPSGRPAGRLCQTSPARTEGIPGHMLVGRPPTARGRPADGEATAAVGQGAEVTGQDPSQLPHAIRWSRLNRAQTELKAGHLSAQSQLLQAQKRSLWRRLHVLDRIQSQDLVRVAIRVADALRLRPGDQRRVEFQVTKRRLGVQPIPRARQRVRSVPARRRARSPGAALSRVRLAKPRRRLLGRLWAGPITGVPVGRVRHASRLGFTAAASEAPPP